MQQSLCHSRASIVGAVRQRQAAPKAAAVLAIQQTQLARGVALRSNWQLQSLTLKVWLLYVTSPRLAATPRPRCQPFLFDYTILYRHHAVGGM